MEPEYGSGHEETSEYRRFRQEVQPDEVARKCQHIQGCNTDILLFILNTKQSESKICIFRREIQKIVIYRSIDIPQQDPFYTPSRPMLIPNYSNKQKQELITDSARSLRAPIMVIQTVPKYLHEGSSKFIVQQEEISNLYNDHRSLDVSDKSATKMSTASMSKTKAPVFPELLSSTATSQGFPSLDKTKQKLKTISTNKLPIKKSVAPVESSASRNVSVSTIKSTAKEILKPQSANINFRKNISPTSKENNLISNHLKPKTPANKSRFTAANQIATRNSSKKITECISTRQQLISSSQAVRRNQDNNTSTRKQAAKHKQENQEKGESRTFHRKNTKSTPAHKVGKVKEITLDDLSVMTPKLPHNLLNQKNQLGYTRMSAEESLVDLAEPLSCSNKTSTQLSDQQLPSNMHIQVQVPSQKRVQIPLKGEMRILPDNESDANTRRMSSIYSFPEQDDFDKSYASYVSVREQKPVVIATAVDTTQKRSSKVQEKQKIQRPLTQNKMVSRTPKNIGLVKRVLNQKLVSKTQTDQSRRQAQIQVNSLSPAEEEWRRKVAEDIQSLQSKINYQTLYVEKQSDEVLEIQKSLVTAHMQQSSTKFSDFSQTVQKILNDNLINKKVVTTGVMTDAKILSSEIKQRPELLEYIGVSEEMKTLYPKFVERYHRTEYKDWEFEPSDFGFQKTAWAKLSPDNTQTFPYILESPILIPKGLEPNPLLRVLRVLFQINPTLITRLFQQGCLDRGIYCVWLFNEGRFDPVFLDAYIPQNQRGNPIFDLYQPWIVLLFKAFAKINGSYRFISEELTHQKAVETLVGVGVQKVYLQKFGSTISLKKAIAKALSMNSTVLIQQADELQTILSFEGDSLQVKDSNGRKYTKPIKQILQDNSYEGLLVCSLSPKFYHSYQDIKVQPCEVSVSAFEVQEYRRHIVLGLNVLRPVLASRQITYRLCLYVRKKSETLELLHEQTCRESEVSLHFILSKGKYTVFLSRLSEGEQSQSSSSGGVSQLVLRINSKQKIKIREQSNFKLEKGSSVLEGGNSFIQPYLETKKQKRIRPLKIPSNQYQ